MAYFVAQGPESDQRWRCQLVQGQPLVVGRGEGGWSINWDPAISRQHVRVELLENQRLRVEQIETATNPVFFDGKKLKLFQVGEGDHFVIGNTKFSIAPDNVFLTQDVPRPDAEQTFNPEYLKKVEFRDADQRIAVLSQLPDVISRASNEADLHIHLVNLLLTGIRRASTCALVGPASQETDDEDIQVLHWDQRIIGREEFQPSLTLIRKALESGETVLHVWKNLDQPPLSPHTVARHGQWAYVSPLPGNENRGWAIYVSGEIEQNRPSGSTSSFNPQDLRDDIKFTELIAATLANLRQVKSLERRQASLRSFFSPVVLDVIAEQDPEIALAPRECDVSVLFCDLRGFSLTSEQYADNLRELLDRVSQALGVTTSEILEERGVVGDFHGDAAMGFWGWPLVQLDGPLRACRAALSIQQLFAQYADQSEHPLKNFKIGLGIASGTAVAGKIGTSDQVKVSVFGPVVNLASRLESMTRYFRVGILADESTAAYMAKSDEQQQIRVRRLAMVRPFGMNSTLTISQVLGPASNANELSDEHIQAYEAALDDFIAGNWNEAFEQLHQVPAEDHAKDFLTVYIAQHNRVAPPDWQGFISISQK